MTFTRFQYFLLFALLVPCWIIAAHYDIDLVNLHAAAGFLHSDLSRVYAQNANLGRYFYPPFSLVLIYPLGDLPYVYVKWFWISLQTIAYVFFWRGFLQLYPQFKKREFLWPWIILFIVAINPIHNNYQSNNIQLMLMAMVVVAETWTTQNARSQFLAGVLVSLAAWIKVFPAFMAAYYFFVKPARVKQGVVAGFLLGLALPILFFGWQEGITLYKDFFVTVTTYTNENSFMRIPDIMSLPSLLERLLFALLPITTIGLITKATVLVISIAFFGLAWWTVGRTESTTSRNSLHFWAMAMALTVFLNPSTRPHYFIFYLPAFASSLEILWPKRPSWSLAFFFLSVLLIAFTVDAVIGKPLNDRLEFLSLPTVGAAILSAVLAVLIFRSQTVCKTE